GGLADRGRGQWVSGISLLLMIAAWGAIALTQQSLWALLLGVVVFDLGLQALHVASQSLIYRLPAETHSRLTAAYMLFYSIGSALGSLASTVAYAWGGWLLVCALGAALNGVALLYWGSTLRAAVQNSTSSTTLSV
ncbi:MFS transporter, partial [Pseudomonas sp. MAFF212427]